MTSNPRGCHLLPSTTTGFSPCREKVEKVVSENPPEQRPKVSWNKRAYISFQKAYENIKESSPASAEKVKETILFITRNLTNHPDKYPLDRLIGQAAVPL